MADGTYIRSLPDGRIYVTVGQAPIYVSSWANVGRVHPTVDVDQKLVDAARTNPNLPLAPHVNYQGTTPGPFVRDYTSGRVFEFVAGAPVYVGSWDAFGGVKPATTIDGYAVGYAGRGAWSFVRPAVPDKTVLAGITAPGKQVYLYIVAGGAPVYVPCTDHFPEPLVDPIRVDERSIESAGHGTKLNLLRAQPTDGTFLYGAKTFDTQKLEGTGQLFWIHSGAAIPVKDEKACGKADSCNDISTIERAGTGGVYNHLATLPADHPQPPC